MINDKGFYGLFSGIFTTSLLQPFENVKMALMIPPQALQQRMTNNFIINLRSAA